MRRPAFAAAAALALTLSTLTAASAADVPAAPTPGGADGPPPGARLDAFLRARAADRLAARRKEVAALKTPADVARRNAALGALFRASFGELPAEKTPLNPRVTGRDRRDGYTVEKVVYESRPGHHVTAVLYLPDAPPPYPGVLVPCGHSANGKAAETYQRISILLAKNGMAALCVDPVGQGERVQWLDASGVKPAVKAGSTAEHTLLGAGALLVGRSAAGYRLWDCVRSLDYLAARPEVDPARLGCTGNSGGGTDTAYLMAYDDRVLAAAPSCYITSLDRLFATIGPQDAEQNLTGQVALGIDHADYLTLRAPKPTLMSVGTRDFFDVGGSWDTFREAKRVYGTLRHAERVDLFESDEPHGFTLPRREACMRWMRRWLLGKDDAPSETPFPIAADGDLQCTETGQVLTSYRGKSAFDLNAERAAELDRVRAERFAGRTPDALRAEVRRLLALPEPAPVSATNLRTHDRDGYRVETRTLVTEPGVEVAAVVFRPDRPSREAAVAVYVAADRALAAEGGPVLERVKAGQTVVLIDPRGTGESAPAASASARPNPAGPDTREAFLSLHLNRPLLGQRVYDLLQALRAEPFGGDEARFHLVAAGAAGPVALHAALFDDRVTAVEVTGSTLSWSSSVREPALHVSLAGVVPDALLTYDLPDLAAALAPRRLTVVDPVGGGGGSAGRDAIDAAYAPARAAYAAAGAADALTLKAGGR